MSDRKINLQGFLHAAFGYHDSESGYGARYPCSRDVLSFFSGRIDSPFGPDVVRPATNTIPEQIQEPWRKSALQLADDLEDLARQLRALVPEEGGQ